MQNPQDEAATITITYMTADGTIAKQPFTLAANSRVSVNVGSDVPENPQVSTKVTSDQAVVVERAMYWGNRTGGHDSIGYTP